DATSTAISWPPAGSLSSSGCASQAYSRLANGSSATNTSTSPSTPRSRRERSSTRCATRLAPGWSAAFIAPGLLRFGGDVAQRAGGVGGGAVGLVQALGQVLGGQLLLGLVARRVPRGGRAARPQSGETRGPRQALGAEHQQRDHGDHQQFGESDVEHPAASADAHEGDPRDGGVRSSSERSPSVGGTAPSAGFEAC